MWTFFRFFINDNNEKVHLICRFLSFRCLCSADWEQFRSVEQLDFMAITFFPTYPLMTKKIVLAIPNDKNLRSFVLITFAEVHQGKGWRGWEAINVLLILNYLILPQSFLCYLSEQTKKVCRSVESPIIRRKWEERICVLNAFHKIKQIL